MKTVITIEDGIVTIELPKKEKKSIEKEELNKCRVWGDPFENIKEETMKKTYTSPYSTPLSPPPPYKDKRYLFEPLYYFGDYPYYQGPTCCNELYMYDDGKIITNFPL